MGSLDTILKRFDSPDEVREFEKGRLELAHLGIVLSGRATAAFDDGRIYDLTAGTIFYIPPEPHDSWVVGNEPYVSLHRLGASQYAK
jgi:AraC-like protein